MDEEGAEAGWERERGARSRLWLYEAVGDTADKRHKDRGGAQCAQAPLARPRAPCLLVLVLVLVLVLLVMLPLVLT